MAWATCVHSTALTRALVPVLRRGRPLGRSTFCRLHRFNSPGFFTLSLNSCKHLVQPVFAQARRRFSSMDKEAAVASPAELQFEGRLKIVQYPDPRLRAKNKRVNTFDESLKKLVDEMFDVMYRTDGIGLSAPQVGINVQLMVFNSVGEPGEGEEIVLVNPRINRYSRKIVPFNEGCLSFPGIYADVERPDSLKGDAQDITGARFEVNLTGLAARVFQHEYDHLEGILFFDRMSDEVLDTIRAELQGLEKKYEERTGKPSPEKVDERRRRKKAVGFGKS
ncbi:Peptide deformylase 1B, chloroplastic [Sesamum alatum]|uniref:Peptide deformylase n=1 Tax=Sesamum alatum TaxID=300844 RepID=A0AAE1Y9U6_9LAMI|nr:Peptide deformylase 1B, chloroplastic [Sesamum alatum]